MFGPIRLPSPLTAMPLISGAVTAALVIIAALVTPAALQQRIDVTWLGLLTFPALAGQAVALGLLAALVVEALGLWRRRGELAALTDAGATSWGGRAWKASLDVRQPRLVGDVRRTTLQRCAGYLQGRCNGRWRLYWALSVLPALLGFVHGQRPILEQPDIHEPFTVAHRMLLIGGAESLLLIVLTGLTWWQSARLIRAWQRTVRGLENRTEPPPAADNGDPSHHQNSAEAGEEHSTGEAEPMPWG